MDKYLCERCGKELVFRCAYSKIDHKLICTECDDKEQPKELMKKIQELEAKLAESEKLGKRMYEQKEYAEKILRMSTHEETKEICKLKQQLAEKDQAIEGLQEINQSLGQTCNNDAKEIERLREQLVEERKKVIERIRDLAEIYTEPSSKGFDFDTYILTEENLNNILDKAERGSYE